MAEGKQYEGAEQINENSAEQTIAGTLVYTKTNILTCRLLSEISIIVTFKCLSHKNSIYAYQNIYSS